MRITEAVSKRCHQKMLTFQAIKSQLRKKLLHLLTFGGVGLVAGLVHAVIGIALVRLQILEPFFANIVAFSVAFWVSYFGHYRFTFKSSNSQKMASVRFFITAILGLLLNQACIYVFVYLVGISYELSLVITFMLVSINTYLVSKYWVF